MDLGVYKALVCSRCGGNEFDTDINSGAKLCKFCNTTFVPDSVDEHSSIKKIDNAELFFHKFKDSDKALKYYKEAVELDPGNFRGWLGLAKVKTDNFKNYSISSSTYNEVKDYINKIYITSTDEIKERISLIFDEYTSKYNEDMALRQEAIKSKITENANKKVSFEKELESIDNEVKSYEDKRNVLNKEINDLNTKIHNDDLIKTISKTSNSIWFMVLAAIFMVALLIINFASHKEGESSDYEIPFFMVLLFVADGVLFLYSLGIFLYRFVRKKGYEAMVNNKKNKEVEVAVIDMKIYELSKKKNDVFQSISKADNSVNSLQNDYNNL